MAFLIEHYAGAFPLWLSPEQVRIIPVAAAHDTYAETLFATLTSAGIRAVLSPATDSLGKRIREAKVEKVPYFIVVGDAEVAQNTGTLEHRERGKIGTQSIEAILADLQKEIQTKAR